MNFDYVKYLEDFIYKDTSYARYKDPIDDAYFDEVDYYSIKLCLAIDKLLQENKEMKRKLEEKEND